MVRAVGPADRDLDRTDTAVGRTMRCYAVFAGAAYLVFLPFLIPAITQAHAVVATWWTPSAMILAVLPGFLVAGHAIGSSDLLRLRVLSSIAALGVLLAVALWPMAWNGNPIDDATVFWLGPFVLLGTICALVAWPTAVTATYMVIAAVGVKFVGNIAQSNAGVTAMIADIACSTVFALVPFALGTAGLRTAAALDRAAASAIAQAQESGAARARVMERAQARALTHDMIMANLLEAARGGASPRLPDRAAATVRALDKTLRSAAVEREPDGDEVTRTIVDVIEENDPQMSISMAGRDDEVHVYPPAVVDAVLGAVAEAARNCARHLPADVVRRCRIDLRAGRISVRIDDDGAGFVRSSVAPERLGISSSIEERMLEVAGGTATVWSRPGAGTSVQVRWDPPGAIAIADGSDALGMRSRTARWLAGVIVGLEVLAAVLNPGELRSPWVALLALLLMACAAAVLVAPGPDPLAGWGTLFVALTPAVMCGIYLFALDPPGQLVPIWITGPPALIVAMLAMRGRPSSAALGFVVTLAVAAWWSSVDAGDALRGVLLIGPSGGFVAIAIVYAAVNRALAGALADAQRQAADAAAEAAAIRAAADERALHLAPITALARPLLARLAEERNAVDAQMRLECSVIEAHLRDLLRARALCTPDVVDAIDAARRRGVSVTLLDDRAVDRDPTDLPSLDEQIRDRLVEALRGAADGAVRIRALPPGRSAAVTVVVDTSAGHRLTELGGCEHSCPTDGFDTRRARELARRGSTS